MMTKKKQFIGARGKDVSSPNDVTPELLTNLLASHYQKSNCVKPSFKVASLQWQPLGRGAMSNVQILNVYYEPSSPSGNDSNRNILQQSPSRQFLAKFRKEEIPLEDLFSVEGQFYQLTKKFDSSHSTTSVMLYGANDDAANNSNSNELFPYELVGAIASGPNWILLEYIPPKYINVIDVHEGCPSDRFHGLLIRLARMHAICWVSNTDNLNPIASILRENTNKLSSAPGAGHTLPPSIRQERFLPAWPQVRERLVPYFQSNEGDIQKLDQIVSWVSQSSRIVDIAKAVAEMRCTLVHGDYHIGNMLFPKTKVLIKQRVMPWLVDWSMAGIGNPCVDLVFFLVVGAHIIPIHEEVVAGVTSDGHAYQSTNSITEESITMVLKQYYQELIPAHEPQVGAEERDKMPSQQAQQSLLAWDTFLTMFSQCIFNQFIILVCYDSLCRSMADASSDSSKVYHDHFDRVNVRCARILISSYGSSRTHA